MSDDHPDERPRRRTGPARARAGAEQAEAGWAELFGVPGGRTPHGRDGAVRARTGASPRRPAQGGPRPWWAAPEEAERSMPPAERAARRIVDLTADSQAAPVPAGPPSAGPPPAAPPAAPQSAAPPATPTAARPQAGSGGPDGNDRQDAPSPAPSPVRPAPAPGSRRARREAERQTGEQPRIEDRPAPAEQRTTPPEHRPAPVEQRPAPVEQRQAPVEQRQAPAERQPAAAPAAPAPPPQSAIPPAATRPAASVPAAVRPVTAPPPAAPPQPPAARRPEPEPQLPDEPRLPDDALASTGETFVPDGPIPARLVPDHPVPATRAGRARAARTGRNLPMAIMVGGILGAAAIASLFTRKEAFVGLASLAVVLAVWELAAALSARKLAVPVIPLAVGSLGMLVSAFVAGEEGLLVSFTLTAFGVLLWRIIDGVSGAVPDVAAAVFTAAYVPFLGGFTVLLLAAPDGPRRVLLLLVLVVVSDVAGYGVGATLGRRPMAATVSPKKSWEGFAGSLLACAVAGAVGIDVLLEGRWWVGLVLGLAIAVTATLGDLAESLLKRDLGVKDMGSVLPGHGGVMERLDSILFSAPVAYLVLLTLLPPP